MEEHLDIWVKISQQIGELNSSIKAALEKISNHESRLTLLEQGKLSFKDATIQYLVKGLIAAMLIIGSLTGSATLIQKVLSPTSTTQTQTQSEVRK